MPRKSPIADNPTYNGIRRDHDDNPRGGFQWGYLPTRWRAPDNLVHEARWDSNEALCESNATLADGWRPAKSYKAAVLTCIVCAAYVASNAAVRRVTRAQVAAWKRRYRTS